MASGDGNHDLWGSSPDDLWKQVLDEVSSESQRRKSSSGDRRSAVDSVRDLELLTKILKVVKSQKDATVAALDKIYDSVAVPGDAVSAPASMPPIDPEVLDDIKQAVQSLASQQQKDSHAEQLKRMADHIESLSQRMTEQAASTKEDAAARAFDPQTVTQPLLEAIAQLEVRVQTQLDSRAAQETQSDQDAAVTPDAFNAINEQIQQLRQTIESQAADVKSQSEPSAESDAMAGVHSELLYQILEQTKALKDQAEQAGQKKKSSKDGADSVGVGLKGLEKKLDDLIDLASRTPEPTEADENSKNEAEALQQKLDQLGEAQVNHAKAQRELAEAQREQTEAGFGKLLDHLSQTPTAKLDDDQFNALRDAVRPAHDSEGEGEPSKNEQLLTEMLGQLREGTAATQQSIEAMSDRLEQVVQATDSAQKSGDSDNGSNELLQQIHDAVQALATRAAEVDQAENQTEEQQEPVADQVAERVTEQFDALRELINKQGDGADQTSLLYEVLETVRGLAKQADTPAESQVDPAMLERLDAIESKIGEVGASLAASDGSSDSGDQTALLEQILEAVTAPVDTDEAASTAAPSVTAELAGKLEGIESKLDSLVQQQPDDANVLNEILQAVQSNAQSAPDANAAASQQALLERIEQSLQALNEKPAEKPSDDVNNAILQNILDAVQTTNEGPVSSDVVETLRKDIAERTDAVRDEMRQNLSGLSKSNESYDEMLLAILAGVNEVKDASAAGQGANGGGKQEALLQQIADAVKSQPDRLSQEGEKTDRVLAELRGLVDSSKLNQKTFERVLAALESNTKAMAATASATASGSGSGGFGGPASDQSYSYSSWSDRKRKDRGPILVVVAVAAVLLIVVGLTIYNTIILNRTQNTFNQSNANKDSSANAGQAKDQKGNGSAASPSSKDALAANNAKSNGTKDGTVNSKDAATKDSTTNSLPTKDGASPVKSKDAGKQPIKGGKDSGSSLTKDGKEPFELFPKDDGTKQPTPDVPDKIIQAIAQETKNGADANNANATDATAKMTPIPLTDAKRIVFLVHASGQSAEAMPVLLGELNRTIGQLDENQQFTVLFSEGQRAVEVPPAGWKEGTNRNKEWVAGWMDVTAGDMKVRPASSPYEALGDAMAYKPDMLWLFSDGIAGDLPGQVKPDALLAKLKTLNAERKTHMNATQVVNKDAGDVLKQAAEQNGGTFIFVEAAGGAAARGN